MLTERSEICLQTSLTWMYRHTESNSNNLSGKKWEKKSAQIFHSLFLGVAKKGMGASFSCG